MKGSAGKKFDKMHFLKMNVFKTFFMESQNRQEEGIYQNKVKSFS